MALTVNLVTILFAFSYALIPSASTLTSEDVCGVDTHIAEVKYAEKQSHIPQWLAARFDIVLGFVLGFFSTSIVDYLRTRRKAKQFRLAACSELKQALAELTTYAIHPDSTVDKEKVQLWWDSMRNFNLREVILPTEYDEEYEKLKNLEWSPEQVDAFVTEHNSRKERRRSQNKMMPPRKLNYIFISRNIETASILNVRDTSRLLNIFRRIDALNSCSDSIDFAYKETFDGSISSANYANIVLNYYSNCQFFSDYAKITAKEVADLIIKWQ